MTISKYESTTDYESKTAEMLRTDFSGTIWFGATVIGSATLLGALLSTGWRPNDLPALAEAVWWFGFVFIVIGIMGLAYAGCPVLGFPIEKENRLKNIAVQGGLLLFAAGSLLTLFPVLLSPPR